MFLLGMIEETHIAESRELQKLDKQDNHKMKRLVDYNMPPGGLMISAPTSGDEFVTGVSNALSASSNGLKAQEILSTHTLSELISGNYGSHTDTHTTASPSALYCSYPGALACFGK